MSEAFSAHAIVELESRQDEVLRRLDELEAQIQRALVEFAAVAKKTPAACDDPAPAAKPHACGGCKRAALFPAVEMPGLVNGAQQPQS